MRKGSTGFSPDRGMETRARVCLWPGQQTVRSPGVRWVSIVPKELTTLPGTNNPICLCQLAAACPLTLNPFLPYCYPPVLTVRGQCGSGGWRSDAVQQPAAAHCGLHVPEVGRRDEGRLRVEVEALGCVLQGSMKSRRTYLPFHLRTLFAPLTSKTRERVLNGCPTPTRSNYALSGAGLTIDVPVAEIDVANSSFINNTAFGSAQELLAAAGINITATAPATTPSPAAALAVAAPSAPPPTAPAGTTLMPPLPVPTMPYAVISPSGSSDYQSSDADAGGDVPDYGSSMGSNIGSGSSRQGVAIDSILAPPESCGAGGGGGLCIRGAQDVTVSAGSLPSALPRTGSPAPASWAS